jgi:hypothetical protein
MKTFLLPSQWQAVCERGRFLKWAHEKYVQFFLMQSTIDSASFEDLLRDIHIHRVLQTIQMKLILLCVWAERAVLGNSKTALKFKYKI